MRCVWGVCVRVLLGPPSFASRSLIRAGAGMQVLVGRVAMAAFYATCQWEVSMAAAMRRMRAVPFLALHGPRANTPIRAAVLSPQVLTGLGPVSQLSVSTGLPRIAAQLLLAAFVVHGLYGFSPSTPTWSSQNRNDLLRRPRGVPRAIINPFTEPGRFFGYRCGYMHTACSSAGGVLAWHGLACALPVYARLACGVTSHPHVLVCVLACSEWGFTKANEVFAGRWVMSAEHEHLTSQYWLLLGDAALTACPPQTLTLAAQQRNCVCVCCVCLPGNTLHVCVTVTVAVPRRQVGHAGLAGRRPH